MSDSIDKESPIPYYVQLKEILTTKIQSNRFADGKLPSEKDLALRYGITVTTVRKVLAQLQNDDRIYKRKGLGSFVKKPKLELDIAKYLSFGRILREKGFSESIEVVSKDVLDFDKTIMDGFEIQNPSRSIIHIERVRYVNEEPLAIEKMYFNNEICGSMMNKASDGLIYDFLIHNLHINFAHIDEYLEPINLDARDARLLTARPGAAALLITKISYDHHNSWLEYSNTIIRGDKCRYHVSLNNRIKAGIPGGIGMV